VLIEVMNVLGVFRDKIVLVGGWVPDLLYPNSGHIGSLDVELAISQTAIGVNAYETILNRMVQAGYEILKAKFAALTAVGPTWAAKVAQEQGEDFAQVQRSAFEYAQALFATVEKDG